MEYRFLGFVFDVPNQELLHGRHSLPLSARNFRLLHVLVENPGRVFTRDELIERVWPGRFVTQNSLDQALSRVRRTLAEVTQTSCIETVYGKGIRFLPEVSIIDTDRTEDTGSRRKNPRHRLLWVVATPLILVSIILVQWSPDQQSGLNVFGARAGPVVLLMPLRQEPEQFPLGDGIPALLGQVLGLSGVVEIRAAKEPPDDPANDGFLTGQWRVSPDLKVVTTRLGFSEDGFALQVVIHDRERPVQRHMLEAASLAELTHRAAAWLVDRLGPEHDLNGLNALLSSDHYLIETYLRGLASIGQGDIDNAATFFETCLAQDQDFALARLELARMRYRQGRSDDALALLATLAALASLPGLQIEIAALQGDILDTIGQFEAARELFEATLTEHDPTVHPQLASIRYNLSYTLSNLGEFDQALAELDGLETHLPEGRNPELLAHVHQRQGSINLQMGRSELAAGKTRAALVLFDRLNDTLGRAKTLSLMGRIYAHQARYAEAEQYFSEALTQAEASNYPLGIGATLNELISIYLAQAKFGLATAANERMRQIAIEIGYAAMLQIARQYDIEIAVAFGQWERGSTLLEEHLATARASGHQRWIVRNHQLRIAFLLAQGQPETVGDLIDAVQDYILISGEQRMQPALNLQKGRWLILNNRDQEAIEIIDLTRDLAVQLDDGESLSKLAELHAGFLLDRARPQDALNALGTSTDGLPRTHGQLRLCARANAALGRRIEGLDCALKLRQRAFESWSPEDRQLLASLQDGSGNPP